MKRFTNFITLSLTIAMLITSLASCSSKMDGELSSDSDESSYGGSDFINSDNSLNIGNGDINYNPNWDLSKFPDNAFPIFDGAAYTLKIVIAEKAPASVRQVATSLRTELKKKTNVDITESNDYLKAGTSHDANAYEILVGETNHVEASSIYNVTDYNNYGIKTIGRKIIFYFSTADEGNELVKIFMNAVKSNDKQALWVENGISTTKTTTVNLGGLPKYPATSLSTVDCDDDTSMVVAKDTTLEKFDEYCKTLTSSGYTEYSRRENVDGNYFRTYTKGTTAVTAYFSNGRKQARVIVGPIKDIPSKDKDTSKVVCKPTMTFIGPSESIGNSLSLIYELDNGKFLIIDGGVILADRIYKELKEIQPNATKFVIAGWFVSHPHNDHQDGFEHFIKQHGHEVDIKNIFFNYVTPSFYDNLTSPDHQDPSNREGHRVIRLRELLDKYLTRSTRVVKPHTGQIYSFGSATVEILSTVEDYLPTKLDHINTTSMIIRVTVGGTSTTVLADASDTTKKILLSMYNSHLKSDMVTLAHHGVWVDTPEIYKRIAAKVLLWPSNTASAQQYYNKNYSRPAITEALNQATDVYLARGTDVKVDLPYKTVGNKQAFMNSVLK